MFKYEEYLPAQRNELHWNRYVKFIEMCRKTAPKKRTKGYFIHHIIPKSYLPKELRKDKDNLIVLSSRQHFIAHLILWKALGGPMAKAFLLTSEFGSLSSRQYEQVMKDVSKRNSENAKGEKNSNYGKHWSEEVRLKISNSNKGRTHTEEEKKNLSKKSKEMWASPEFKESARKRMQGNKNALGLKHTEETKKIMSEKSKAYFSNPENREKMSEKLKGRPSGNKGHKASKATKEKQSKAQKGRIIIHNPFSLKEKRIFPSELDKFISKGWRKGKTPKIKK